MVYFDNVDDIDLHQVKWSSSQFQRNPRTYEMLMNICYFVVCGLLLYAKIGEAVVPDGSPFTIDGNTFSVRTLNLNQEFEGIKRELEEVAEIVLLDKIGHFYLIEVCVIIMSNNIGI